MPRLPPILAPLLALLLGCDDDGGKRRDEPDAPGPGPGPGSASVTVLFEGRPRADHPVTFQAPDGTELATVMTGADGVASAEVPAGSSVTTLDLQRPGNDTRRVVTVMGVEPGDRIVLRGDADLPQMDQMFTYPPFAGTGPVTYQVNSTCTGDGAGNETSPTFGSTECSPRVDTFVEARDDAGNERWLAQLDQPWSASHDLTGETWKEYTAVTTTYTGGPEFSSSYAFRAFETPRGRVASCGGAFDGSQVEMVCPLIAGTFVVDWLSLSVGDSIALFASPHTELAQTFDLAPVRSPIAAVPLFDLATRTVTWTEGTTGATPQFVSARITSDGPEAPFIWQVLAPYQAPGMLVLPPLVGPAAVLGSATDASVDVTTGSAEQGYGPIRALGPADPQWRVTPDTGRVTLGRINDG